MKQYIIVKDSSNKQNIWEVIDCLNVNGQDTYEIHTRTTTAFVEKDLCIVKKGSTLLYYNSDRTIDIDDSNIELESEGEYIDWLMNQKKNINPFEKLDKTDLGYMEDYYLDGEIKE